MKIHRKLIGISVVFCVLLFLSSYFSNFAFDKFEISQRFICQDKSLFGDHKSLLQDFSYSDKLINSDGTIKYFFDDFSEYLNGTKVIDQFENLDNYSPYPNIEYSLSNVKINGDKSLVVSKKQPFASIIISKDLENGALSEWNNRGIITFWLNVDEDDGVRSVAFELVDANGNTRRFNDVVSLDSSVPNYHDRDDVYPDYNYMENNSASDEWTDFWIRKGWNFIFFYNNHDHYVDEGSFDMSTIVKYRIYIESSDVAKKLIVDNLRIVEGFQKGDNPISSSWYSPHGRPQYGVFDVDSVDGTTSTKLINVRQSQYLSNGDHGRMLSKFDSPLNFILRVKFDIEDFRTSNSENNTWVRVNYDFDPEWDPGHDWYGLYMSAEWDKVGLLTVYPIQRFYLQDQEPSSDSTDVASSKFEFREGKYEVQMKVMGQFVVARIYHVGNKCLLLKKEISYLFARDRYQDKRLPFAIEVTGDAKLRVYEVEIAEL